MAIKETVSAGKNLTDTVLLLPRENAGFMGGCFIFNGVNGLRLPDVIHNASAADLADNRMEIQKTDQQHQGA